MRNDGEVYKLKIGLLSADGVMMACFNFFDVVTEDNYLYYSGYSNSFFWTSLPFIYTNSYSNVFNGSFTRATTS